MPPSPSLPNFTLDNWNPSSTQSSSCSSLVSLFFRTHSTRRHHKYWLYQSICQVKPIKFIIKLYIDRNTLWVNHASYQKAEPLRDASLSKLDNTVNINSIFNAEYAEFPECRCSFIFTTQLVHTATPTISTKNPFRYCSHFYKIIFTVPTNTPSIPPQFFTSLLFCTSQQSTPKIVFLPHLFSQFRLHKRARELGRLVMSDTVLVSPSFLKLWSMITGLTITDS